MKVIKKLSGGERDVMISKLNDISNEHGECDCLLCCIIRGK